jgi:hypothetical protein
MLNFNCRLTFKKKNCSLHLPVKEVELNDMYFKILKKVIVLVSCQVYCHTFFFFFFDLEGYVGFRISG